MSDDIVIKLTRQEALDIQIALNKAKQGFGEPYHTLATAWCGMRWTPRLLGEILSLQYPNKPDDWAVEIGEP